jgi:hypothetical protein
MINPGIEARSLEKALSSFERRKAASNKTSRFRCGLVEVDAIRWNGRLELSEAPAWLLDAIKRGIVSFAADSSALRIASGARDETLAPGDWLVHEQSGEILCCKAFLFRFAFRPA